MSANTLFLLCLLAFTGMLSVSAAPTTSSYIRRAREPMNRQSDNTELSQTTQDTTTAEVTPEAASRSVNVGPENAEETRELIESSVDTTSQPEVSTSIPSEECPICDMLCMSGHATDPVTGCDKCDECLSLTPEPEGDLGVLPNGRRDVGFGRWPGIMDMGGDPGFGWEGGVERRVRPKVVVPGLAGTEGAEECDLDCKPQWKPVCGEDGRTYSNVCVKKMEECRTKTKIQIRDIGVC